MLILTGQITLAVRLEIVGELSARFCCVTKDLEAKPLLRM